MSEFADRNRTRIEADGIEYIPMSIRFAQKLCSSLPEAYVGDEPTLGYDSVWRSPFPDCSMMEFLEVAFRIHQSYLSHNKLFDEKTFWEGEPDFHVRNAFREAKEMTPQRRREILLLGALK